VSNRMNHAAITKRSAIRLTTGLLGLLAGACNSSLPQATPAPTARPEKRRGVPAPPRPVAGTITIGIGSDAQTLQPLLARDTASAAYIATHYNAPLMRRHPETLDWDPTYGTAAGVVIGDQGRTLRFTLKPGLQWSDGKPLTVHDYRYTYARMSDPSTGYPYRDLFRSFEAVTTPDDDTLELTLREPFCPALDYAVLNPIPQHVFGDAPLDTHPASTKPTVGSGAWILSSWTRDQEAVFVANGRFYLGRPPTDRLVFRLARDADTAFALLRTGEIDHAVLQASDWDEAARTPGIRAVGYYPPTAAWTYIGFNLRRPLLSDIRIRRALAHAVDRTRMVTTIRQGHARLIDSIVASASWASTSDVTRSPYDLAKARQLLDEAGWRTPEGQQEGTRTRDGVPLVLRLHYNSGNREREQIATMTRDFARAVGIQIDCIAEEWAPFLNRVNGTHDVDLYILGWSSPVEPHGTSPIWMTGGGQNASGYTNTQVDALFSQATAVNGCRQDERQRLYAELQRTITADVPCIFLWENESLSAYADRLNVNPLTRLGYDYRPWEWRPRPAP